MTTKLTEADLNAAIRSDQNREAYWRDYDRPMTRGERWMLGVALGASVFTTVCSVALYVMWLME